MWTPKMIALRVFLVITAYLSWAAGLGWWGVPFWVMYFSVPAVLITLWFSRDLYLRIFALFVVLRESIGNPLFSPEEVVSIDMTMAQLFKESQRRQNARVDAVLARWKKEAIPATSCEFPTQFSDTMLCKACGVTWDMNDAHPPKCGGQQ